MQFATEKCEALEQAVELLSSSDEKILRYVALELRRCIEAVVYEKLWAYRDRFPSKVAKMWQPPQAFKALLVFEPEAARTKTISIARENELGIKSQGPYRSIGTDYRFKHGWLNYTYNKLGSYLHAAWPFAKTTSNSSLANDREFLQKTVLELRPYVEKTFTLTLAETVEFSCQKCGTTIKANAAGLHKAGEMICLNSSCGCRYFVSIDGVEPSFTLDAFEAVCIKCDHKIQIPAHELKVDHKFSCNSCKQKHVITEQVWKFDKPEIVS